MNLKDEILSNIKRGNLGLIPLKGTSMLPTLFDGDVLSVYAKRDYTVGDIIVFFYPASVQALYTAGMLSLGDMRTVTVYSSNIPTIEPSLCVTLS